MTLIMDEDLEQKLNKIYNYFGGTPNKIDKLFHITGGNPFILPQEKYSQYIMKAKAKDFKVAVLGNPIENFELYHAHGVDSVQFTMDSLLVRRINPFNSYLEGIKFFNDHNVKTYLAFNVQNNNIDFIKHAYLSFKDQESNKRPKFFVISRCITNDKVDSETLKDLFLFFIDQEKLETVYKYKKKIPMKVIFKDPLYSLFAYEKGLADVNKVVHGGCQIGISMLTIENTGDVYACRRMPLIIGKIEDKFSLYDIFMKSPILNDITTKTKCKKCIIYSHCRGCAADAYLQTGDYLNIDTSCWIEKNEYVN